MHPEVLTQTVHTGMNAENSNSELHLSFVLHTMFLEHQANSNCLFCTRVSVGCWCVSACKPIPTSETTHNGAGHFPPSHLAPRSTLSFCFRPTRSSPAVFVYSFPSHFFLSVSYRWILKFSVFGPLNAKQGLNCPATKHGASTEKHRSIHSVWF